MQVVRLALLIFSMIFISVFDSMAQGKGQGNKDIIGEISGVVFDADTTKPLQGATVKLISQVDSKVVSGEITGKNGKFSLENVSQGRYNVEVSYIGYRLKEFRTIIIGTKKRSFDLGKIVMESGDIKTGEIEVTAQKDLSQINFDRKVYNVDKNLAAQGGSAVDVMKNIPSVTVDIDNNVSLRGSSNVKILVDGKQSSMANSDILDMIPASSIENIELMTNPSSKFDPEGMTGIINIVLKKERNDGFNGMFSINVGTADKYNSSINLNLRQSDFNIFVNYNNRFFSMSGDGRLNQSNFFGDTT
jgi:hypothetical protein